MERLILPPCLMETMQRIFDTLDFSRIDFFLDPDLNTGILSGPDRAGNCRVGLRRTVIRFLPGEYDPCRESTFALLVHELVHALQGQTRGAWWHNATSLTCRFLDESRRNDDKHNCLESEAFLFPSTLISAFPEASTSYGVTSCQCLVDGPPWSSGALAPGLKRAFSREAFEAARVRNPAIVKRESQCRVTECFGDGFLAQAYGVIVLSIAAAWALGTVFVNEGVIATAATAAGAIAGAVGGFSFALTAGASVTAAVFAGLAACLIGALVFGFIGALASWVADLFGGGVSGGSLNVMFSTDQGATFAEKATFERTRQQPALAFRSAPDQLFLGWTGTDDRLNVFVAPEKWKTELERSQPCGPGLAFGDEKLFLAWKGTDGHPNCKFSTDGRGFVGHFWSGGDAPRESNLSAAYGRGMLYVAWVGSDNHVRLIQLRPTDPLTEVPSPIHMLSARTGHQCTPALTFGNGQLFLGWSAFEPRHYLHVMRIPVDASGHLLSFDQFAHQTRLNDWTTDLTGPALAYDEGHRRLYLAFTGEDSRVYVSKSTDDARTFSTIRIGNEMSRSDAGPAIAVHPMGIISLSWVGTDGD